MRMRKKDWARPELAACSYYTDQPETLKGHWQEHFARKQPLHLDLGCGKCTFLAELAFRHPEINYIGIDRVPMFWALPAGILKAPFPPVKRPWTT